jgi:hypothetical protein
MENRHEEIKKLLKSSRILLNSKTSINEVESIKKQYGIITEEDITKKIDVAKSIETEVQKDVKRRNEDEKTQGYRILNGLMYVKGSTDTELILTEDEKNAFKETMEEFVSEVSDSVDFYPLVLYPKKVTWSGFLNSIGLKFIFITNDDVYISFESEDQDMEVNPMIKLDDEFEEITKKLKTYFAKFQSKWNKIVADRKRTKIPTENEPMGGKNIGDEYETF